MREPMTSDPISCIGYVRVSTERQAGETHTSLADQEEAIVTLATRLELTVGRWFRDAGASGADVQGRPAFQELLRWCETHPQAAEAPGHILALNDSRWGRFPEPEESAYWRHHLRRLGWIVRLAEGDEVEGDFRTVVRAIGSVQASEYRRNLVANTRRGMRGAATQGFWTRRAPYGYRRMVVHPRGAERVLERSQRKVEGEKVKLTPHPDESQVIRWAYEAYASGGESLGSIAEQLHRMAPGRKWGRTVVATMLKNDAYRGAVVGGKAGAETYGCEDAHEPIVEEELFRAVQRRLERNQAQGAGVRSHYLLTGLLRCIHCGQAYTGGGGGKSRSRNPERKLRRHYKCNGGVSGDCPGPLGTVSRHLVDDAVVELVGETISSPAVLASMEERIQTALEGPDGVGGKEQELRAHRRRWEEKRARLVAAISDGTILPGEAAPELERIRGALMEIEGATHRVRFAGRRVEAWRAQRDRILSVARDFPSLAARLTGPRLRELVEPWIGEATFDKVTRRLSLGIRPMQAFPGLLLYASPGPDGQEQAPLLYRTRSLLQAGHEYRIDDAREQLERGRTA